MAERPTYDQLERKINKLEKKAREYMHKEREFNQKRKSADYSHMRRTISLLKINEELNREIKEIKSVDNERLKQISHKLKGRIKELNCLYEISSFRRRNDFSLDSILQEMVDFIPPACQFPETTCARIVFDDYEFVTENFSDTPWKQSFNIAVNNKRIGVLEVCRFEKNPEIERAIFLEEEISLINAVAESIARIVEREWAEEEIRKCRNNIEELINQTH
jgi:hypothetical protein